MIPNHLRIGLIGFGAIGAPVAQGILSGLAGSCSLTAVLVRGESLAAARAVLPDGCLLTTDLNEFLRQSPDLVVETAGHEALRICGQTILAAGADLMTVSAGVLADDELRLRLVATALAHGCRILVPSGAIVGLDGVSAAAVGTVCEVTHVTRKPPTAWHGTVAQGQVDLDHLTEPTVLLESTARESAAMYPTNVNVQAAVALAGIGLDRTRVRVVVDPSLDVNVHEVTVRGDFGEIQVIVRGVPTPGNAKTSRLTALAVIRAIRNATSPLVIGV